MQPFIFDIHKLSTHDGPGFRTVLFFKGCPLRCQWCHNPEGRELNQEIWIFPDRCIRCGQCVTVCPAGSLSVGDKGIELKRSRCTACEFCCPTCRAKVILPIGKKYSIDDLMTEIMREKPFMDQSGGGVTLSGGEVLLFPEAAVELLKRLKTENIHTAIDTCGAVPVSAIDAVLPYTDLFLYDLKVMDDKLHRIYTGKSNKNILENLIYLSAKTANSATKIIIRTPLVPDISDTFDNIRAIAFFISTQMQVLPEQWELCAFNPLPFEKYRRLDLPWKYPHNLMNTAEDVQKIRNEAIQYFENKDFIRITGLTAN